MIKSIIFDCFGVLYPQASGAFFEKHSDQFKNDAAVLDDLNRKIDLGQLTRQEFFLGLEDASGMPAKEIQKEIDDQLVLDQKLVDLISRLKQQYKIGLLSNAGQEEIEILYRDQIEELFDAIVVSYEVKSLKPDAQIFTVCLDRLDVAPEKALLVDDSTTNLIAAKKLGIQTLHYPQFGTIPHELKDLARS